MKKIIILAIAIIIIVPLGVTLYNTVWSVNYMEHHQMYGDYLNTQKAVGEVLVNVNTPEDADKAAAQLAPLAVMITEMEAKQKQMTPLNDFQNTLIGQIYGGESKEHKEAISKERARILKSGNLTPDLQKMLKQFSPVN